MQAIGIICEYNPFHAGHAYQLEQAPEGVRVCLMSGNFTQRGEAAILPPVVRAAMAIAGGADLVLELPFPFACGSARYFATAGVRALSALGCDTLCFGSESADSEALLTRAAYLNSPEYAQSLAARDAKTGDAAAHFEALGGAPGSNDILALEYTRAILEDAPNMQIAPILRVGEGYRDTAGEGEYPSATALRLALSRGEDISARLPRAVREIFQEETERLGGIAQTEKLGTAMLARLRTGEDFSGLADCAGGIAAHLCLAASRAVDYPSLCREAATKRYTDGRIRRALLYMLAGVRREDLTAPPAYLRLLAANERGRTYLAESRKSRTLSVITRIAELPEREGRVARQLALSQISDALYALCLPHPTLPATLSTATPYML